MRWWVLYEILPENFIFREQKPTPPLIFAIFGSQFYTIHIQNAYGNQIIVAEGILGSLVPDLTNNENSKWAWKLGPIITNTFCEEVLTPIRR